MGVLFTYTGEAAKTKEKIEEGRKSITINQLYKHSNGWYWYLNNKGYIHIIQALKVNFMGEFSHYTIIDQLLTKDNMLKESKRYGRYKSLESCIEDIEKDL